MELPLVSWNLVSSDLTNDAMWEDWGKTQGGRRSLFSTGCTLHHVQARFLETLFRIGLDMLFMLEASPATNQTQHYILLSSLSFYPISIITTTSYQSFQSFKQGSMPSSFMILTQEDDLFERSIS